MGEQVTTTKTRTIVILADTVGRARCRDDRCGAFITWAENAKTGRRMCFDGELVALRTDTDACGRQLWEVDLATNHWATCPGAERFKRR